MTSPSSVLRAELARVTEQLAALAVDRDRVVAASMDSNADDEHDPEGATIAFEREQVTALMAQTERTRDQIERALESVEAGSYGVCESCGRSIGEGRLTARPYARTCIDCAA